MENHGTGTMCERGRSGFGGCGMCHVSSCSQDIPPTPAPETPATMPSATERNIRHPTALWQPALPTTHLACGSACLLVFALGLQRKEAIVRPEAIKQLVKGRPRAAGHIAAVCTAGEGWEVRVSLLDARGPCCVSVGGPS